MPISNTDPEKFYCFVLHGAGENEGKVAFVQQPRKGRSPLHSLPYVLSTSLAEAIVALREKYHLSYVGDAKPVGAVTYKYASAAQTLGAASNPELITVLEVCYVQSWKDGAEHHPFEYFAQESQPEVPFGDEGWVNLALKRGSPFDATIPTSFHPLVCPTARREEYGSGRPPTGS